MIYTVTFNPALDYTISLKQLLCGQVNRTASERIYPGGKGLNVSLMLKRLGIPSVALGFAAGFTGKELSRLLAEQGCHAEFTELPEGTTRINVKIKSAEETDLNGQGPDIPASALSVLLDRLDGLTQGDVLVLAGSIPSSLPSDVYERILRLLSGRGIRFVVDATGALLESTLRYCPFLIKPNHHELSELFQKTLSTREEITEKMRILQQRGAQNVLVSMAEEGALLLDETGVLRHTLPPKGRAKNSVGAGDSMVAGFLAGFFSSGGSFEEAFFTGVCAGSATAFSDWLGDRDMVERLWRELRSASQDQI